MSKMRGTQRQREELDRCAFCLELCCLSSGGRRQKLSDGCDSDPDGIAWCEQCFATVHLHCWEKYRCERTCHLTKDATLQSLSIQELKSAVVSWFPCPTCRTTGRMAVWPKPRKRTMRQQLKDIERSVSDDTTFVAQVEVMLLHVQDATQRRLLNGLREASLASIAQQQRDLIILGKQLAAKQGQAASPVSVCHAIES